MEKVHRELLKKLTLHLRQNLEVDDDLVYLMMSRGIISNGDRMDINKHPGGAARDRQQRVDTFLDLLPFRGSQAFIVFLEALQDSSLRGNNELAGKLRLEESSATKKTDEGLTSEDGGELMLRALEHIKASAKTVKIETSQRGFTINADMRTPPSCRRSTSAPRHDSAPRRCSFTPPGADNAGAPTAAAAEHTKESDSTDSDSNETSLRKTRRINPWKDKRFLAYHQQLVQKISPEEARTAAFSAGFLSKAQTMVLMSMAKRTEHNEMFLHLVMKGNGASFRRFLDMDLGPDATEIRRDLRRIFLK